MYDQKRATPAQPRSGRPRPRALRRPIHPPELCGSRGGAQCRGPPDRMGPPLDPHCAPAHVAAERSAGAVRFVPWGQRGALRPLRASARRDQGTDRPEGRPARVVGDRGRDDGESMAGRPSVGCRTMPARGVRNRQPARGYAAENGVRIGVRILRNPTRNHIIRALQPTFRWTPPPPITLLRASRNVPYPA